MPPARTKTHIKLLESGKDRDKDEISKSDKNIRYLDFSKKD
jgi:hypothetical protein